MQQIVLVHGTQRHYVLCTTMGFARHVVESRVCKLSIPSAIVLHVWEEMNCLHCIWRIVHISIWINGSRMWDICMKFVFVPAENVAQCKLNIAGAVFETDTPTNTAN